MGRILPTSSDATARRSDDPTVISLDDERSEHVLSAVQSETGRSVFRTLTREPATPSGVADRLDASVENVGYHLDNLRNAGLVDVVDTVYSEKGREMDVYGPSEDPLVLVLGSMENEQGVRDAFAELVPVVGPVSVLIALKETIGRAVDLGDLLGELP